MELVDMESLLGKKYPFTHVDKGVDRLVFRFRNEKERQEFMVNVEKYVDYFATATYKCRKGEAVR